MVAIEVKSGRDYTIHTALNKFINNTDYDKIIYTPVYCAMFL